MKSLEIKETDSFVRPRTAGAWDLRNWALKHDGTIRTKNRPGDDIELGDVLGYTFSHCAIAASKPDKDDYFTVWEGNTDGAGTREGGAVLKKKRHKSSPVHRLIPTRHRATLAISPHPCSPSSLRSSSSALPCLPLPPSAGPAPILSDGEWRWLCITCTSSIIIGTLTALIVKSPTDTMKVTVGRTGISILLGTLGTREVVIHSGIEAFQGDAIRLAGWAAGMTVLGMTVGYPLILLVNTKGKDLAKWLFDKMDRKS